MKFNREHLEELTLQKIKEVNDEAGYRKYLEVPEMVNIIASIIEEKQHTKYIELRGLLQTIIDRVRTDHNTISLDFVEYAELVLSDHDKKD
jgi:hypothetical protein